MRIFLYSKSNTLNQPLCYYYMYNCLFFFLCTTLVLISICEDSIYSPCVFTATVSTRTNMTEFAYSILLNIIKSNSMYTRI